MNGFEQIKSFYSWVFNNPDKIRPTHISLYLFLWNQANRANWAEWIKCPYDLAMQGACIGNNGTYYRCLDDLKSFGLIDYQKGINNYKAPLVKLICLYKIEHLSEQLYAQVSEQVTVPLSEQQYAQLPAHIYKLITTNIKPITDNFDKVEKYINGLKKERKIISEIIPEWKKDFLVYQQNCRCGFDEIKKDIDWINLQKSYYRNVDIIKSIEKCFVNYWSTESGWKNKIKAGTININWKTTMGKALQYKENKVYLEDKI